MFKEFENILKLILRKLDNSEVLTKLDQISQNHTTAKFIDTATLNTLYSISIEQQKHLRRRIKNPLPFHQDGSGGKIRYKVADIDKWLDSQKVKYDI